MNVSAVLAAWLLLVVVLVASGIGKIRHTEGAEEAFVALGVPQWLNRRWIIRAHPCAEIGLAAFLLTVPHPLSVVAAALACVLFLAYLVMIWRVVASGDEASCNCFGSLGSATVDRWTVVRNALLAVVAVLVLVDGSLGGSALARFSRLGEGWWWVLAMAVTAAATYLVTRETPSEPQEAAGEYGPVDDYLRLPIPDVQVRAAASVAPVSLRDVAGERAQVLLLLQPSCGPCRIITSKLADWAREVPEIDFRVLNSLTHEAMLEISPEWAPYYVEEVGGSVVSVFGITGVPAAVLLGMDGLLAGGPVQGSTDVEQMVADIQEQIAPSREWAAEAARITSEQEAVGAEAV